MEQHKSRLDREYEDLLNSFRRELDKIHTKHQSDLEKKVSFCNFSKQKFRCGILSLVISCPWLICLLFGSYSWLNKKKFCFNQE